MISSNTMSELLLCNVGFYAVLKPAISPTRLEISMAR